MRRFKATAFEPRSYLEAFHAKWSLYDRATLLEIGFVGTYAFRGGLSTACLPVDFHGNELVNRDVAAVIKAHNLIDIRTRPRHPESNGIAERFNGTIRTESDNDHGNNYLQAEAIIDRLVHHYNEERLHATPGLHDAGYVASRTAGRSSEQACAANSCGPCAL